MFFFYIISSFVCVAFGQAAWVPALAPVAAILGYALFWKGAQAIVSSKRRFWLSVGWYGAVQGVQLSWMTDTQFQGYYILGVYGTVIFLLGLQFGLFSYFIFKFKKSVLASLALASFWVIMEWSRLYFLCGFPWNPAGMALAASPLAIQGASFFGVLGLSFWVMWTNLLVRNRMWALVSMVALCPFIWGWVKGSEVLEGRSLSVALVETDFLPSEKIPLFNYPNSFIPPLIQWDIIWASLDEGIGEKKIDLIVFPEAIAPHLANHPIYPYEWVAERLHTHFGAGIVAAFPTCDQKKVSNSWIAQTLSNHYEAEVVAGFDDREGEKYYQAAFHFTPYGAAPARYEKKILVPLAEYLPFQGLKSLTKFYGIQEFYTPGAGAKVMRHTIPMAFSICYEEVFGDYVRQGRVKGGELLVNLTNDNWFPHSRLGKQHFEHARLRAVENGVSLIRSCNRGVSGVIDRLGRGIIFPHSSLTVPKSRVFVMPVSLSQSSTLYTQLGDSGILSLSLFFVLIAFISHRRDGKILDRNVEMS